MQVVYDCDSRRISGPSLLEVTCHQHLDGALQDMAWCITGYGTYASKSIDASTCYTQMPLCNPSVEILFITDAAAKYSKMLYIF